jgi:hypothetical protein
VAFQNPSITGAAIVKALDPDVATAAERDASGEQSDRDEADLRDLERAEYYDDPAAPAQAPAVTKPRRSFLDRLRRR